MTDLMSRAEGSGDAAQQPAAAEPRSKDDFELYQKGDSAAEADVHHADAPTEASAALDGSDSNAKSALAAKCGLSLADFEKVWERATCGADTKAQRYGLGSEEYLHFVTAALIEAQRRS